MELKKSSVDMTDLAIGVTILGVVVTVGSLVLTNIRNNHLTESQVVTTGNETITPSGNGVILANKWGAGIVRVTNASNGVIINSGNYTSSISSADGATTLTNSTNTFPSNWNVTYQWYNTSSRTDYVIANKSLLGIAEYGSWFKVLVIVGIASVILSLIFLAFGRNSNSSNISY